MAYGVISGQRNEILLFIYFVVERVPYVKIS